MNRGNDPGAEADFTTVRKIGVREGFTMVKGGRGSLVLEKNACRIRWRLREDGPGLVAETSLPFQPEILPFILSGRAWKASEVTGNGQHLFLRTGLNDEEGAAGLLRFVSNVGAMAERKQLPAMLRPLASAGTDGLPWRADASDLLRERLLAFRSILVEADRATLVHYLSGLGSDVYEADPSQLFGLFPVGLAALDDLSLLSGTIILIGAGFLDEEKRSYLVHLLERQPFPDTWYGARFLLHAPPGRFRDSLLPRVTLPCVLDDVREMLVAEGLGGDLESASTVHGLVRAGASAADALQSLRRQRALRDGLSGHESSNRISRPPARIPRGDRGGFADLAERTRSVFREHAVGHDAVAATLSDLLVSWYLTEPGPLTLAFVGPSGAGKNHFAEIVSLATAGLFGLPRSQYVPVNAASMVGLHSLWSLVGVQAGLKGAERPGILETLAPGGVLTIDELDKASPEANLQGFLTEVMEEGGFRNGHGLFRRLPKSVVILTMNAGSEASRERFERIGFGGTDEESRSSAVTGHYRDAYRANLLPALRGRIRKALFFDLLSEEERVLLALREIARMQATFEALELAVPLPEGSAEALARKIASAADPKLGARGVKGRVSALAAELLGNAITKEA